jgi:SAM-dependent methyltransferase
LTPPEGDDGVTSWAEQIAVSPPPTPFETLPAALHHAPTGADLPTAIDTVKLEQPIADYLARDDAPIPMTSDREFYHGERHFEWWLSGLQDYLSIKHLIGSHGCPLLPGHRVLELGAASGRVTRHLLAQEPKVEVWASDINSRHVAWMQTFLDPRLNAFQNSVLPHLPIEDGTFDLVSAFSVFTHIDEFETAWILELRRILKSGGMAYLSIHSDHLWRRVPSLPGLLDQLLALRPFVTDFDLSPELFSQPMPQGRVVLRDTRSNVYNTQVFHSIDHVRAVWGRFFEIVEIIPGGHGYQDVVLLRKAVSAL